MFCGMFCAHSTHIPQKKVRRVMRFFFIFSKKGELIKEKGEIFFSIIKVIIFELV